MRAYTMMTMGRNHKIAKILTLIPVIVFAVTLICMGLAMILEGPTGRGAIYSIFALIGILCIFLAPLPCLALSVIGTVFAAKAIKEGDSRSRKFLLLGIVEIAVYVIGAILVCIMFIAGQGV